MEKRSRSLLLAAGLTLLPVALMYLVLAFARVGPAGPQIVWPILLFAPIAMWSETRAIHILLNMFRDRHDPVLFAILPLGLISVVAYALHGFVFVLGLPSLLKYFV